MKAIAFLLLNCFIMTAASARPLTKANVAVAMEQASNYVLTAAAVERELSLPIKPGLEDILAPPYSKVETRLQGVVKGYPDNFTMTVTFVSATDWECIYHVNFMASDEAPLFSGIHKGHCAK